MSLLRDKRIGVIGAGAIGGVVIDRLLGSGASRPEVIFACETRAERRQEIATRYRVAVQDTPETAGATDLVVLAVPPPAVPEVLARIGPQLSEGRVLMSFAGGIPVTALERMAPAGAAVIRVNPNSPSVVGEGFNPVVYGRHATGPRRTLAEAFLDVLGRHPEVDDAWMNLYTALTAVGPTYFLPVLEALISAGVAAGLSREAATAAATATATGTAAMAARRPEPLDQLKLFTGLRPLDDQAVKRLVADAIEAAVTRMDDLQRKMAGQP